MANKMEITRTPDRQKGLESISEAVAKALNFTLGQEIEKDKQRKALEAMAQEQQFKRQLQQDEMDAALERLQKDMAYKTVADERARKLKEQQLQEDIRHNKALEATDADKVKAMREANRLRDAKADKGAYGEWLKNVLGDRFDELNALTYWLPDDLTKVDPAIISRRNQLMREIEVYQRAKDKFGVTGDIPSNLLQQLEGTETTTFPARPGAGVYEPGGPSPFILPPYGELESTANGEQPKTKPRLY